MKVFLSVSYSSQVDEAGRVLPTYRKELEAAIKEFETVNHYVYCAPREDNWTLNDTSPAEAFNVDMRAVEGCDLFIAFIGNRISAGIQMEIGYALAKGKRVVLALPTTDKLGYVNQGLVDSGNAKLILFKDHSDLLDKLKDLARPAKS
jgi:nucleoside 2-deoxyribosyltransferase